MVETTNDNTIEIIRANLEQKVNELKNIIENKINGSIQIESKHDCRIQRKKQ